MSKIETVKIPANNEAGYVIVNAEDAGAAGHGMWKVEGSKIPHDEKHADGSLKKTYTEADSLAQLEDAPTADELMKLTKAELVAKAENAGIEVVPDEVNKAQIVAKLLGETDESDGK